MKIQRFLLSQLTDALVPGKVFVLYGPRQVGKTTLAQQLIHNYSQGHPAYLNWDDDIHRKRIKERAWPVTEKLIVFDELHKYARWRNLLKGLFAELGYESRLIACTTVEHIDPKEVFGKLRKLLEQSNGRFVDVHNYLILETPEGEMIVDATLPITTKGMGTVVNERFVL